MAKAAEGAGWNRFAASVFNGLERFSQRMCSRGHRSPFRYQQLIEFHQEKNRWLAANRDCEPADPLHICGIPATRADCRTSPRCRKMMGQYDADFTHLGLRLDGFVFRRATKQNHLELWLNDHYIRTLPLHRTRFAPPYFHYHVKREVLARFPKSCRISIRTAEGHALDCLQGPELAITLPHADGSVFEHLAAGGHIDKKGFLSRTPEGIRARQQHYLSIYSQAREYCNCTLNTPLFLMYGTLLGHIREGDFIEGDDDFDVGYLSRQTHATAVKQEVMQLVVKLVRAGFTCSFNRNGRLFRLRRKNDPPATYLDVRPVWFEDGCIWAHKQACLPLRSEDFEPVRTETLRGVEVDVPRRAEHFLAAYYGDNWKTPDPDYSNASRHVPRFVQRKLASVCITPADYQQMRTQIEAQPTSEAGELVPTGLYPLYPLEQYEAHCEW
ncbi:LicD family protein [Halorhodospira sp. 9622]|uniref:LicD family protein n=1 Tax=Halorhodospira sp. 9622 TaxID=2899136 RepID=UPI001EE8BCF4|nr:LicD family protein [Halorhodospira sp. 9622]